MTRRKENSIRALNRAVTNEQAPGRTPETVKDLYAEYLRENNKRKREKLLQEFAARKIEFAAYLDANPELVTAEARIALLSAASGGVYTDTTVQTDERGRKRKTETRKESAPNVAAIEKLLSAEKANKVENNLMDMLRDCLTEGEDDGV